MKHYVDEITIRVQKMTVEEKGIDFCIMRGYDVSRVDDILDNLLYQVNEMLVYAAERLI